MITLFTPQRASRASGWIRMGMVCACLIVLPIVECVLALCLPRINSWLAVQQQGGPSSDVSTLRIALGRCSEEQRTSQKEWDIFIAERRSLEYPSVLMSALAEALPARAWLEGIAIKNGDVTISGNVNVDLEAKELTDSLNTSGALSSVKLQSIKPLPSDAGAGFKFVVTGRAVVADNS